MQIDIPKNNTKSLPSMPLRLDTRTCVSIRRSIGPHTPAAGSLPQMSEEELNQSVAECERGIAEIRAGRGRAFRQAMLEIGRKRAFPLPE